MFDSLARVLIFIFIFVCIIVFNSESCAKKSISFEGHSYSLTTGCMVKHKGKWLPLENIRGFD